MAMPLMISNIILLRLSSHLFELEQFRSPVVCVPRCHDTLFTPAKIGINFLFNDRHSQYKTQLRRCGPVNPVLGSDDSLRPELSTPGSSFLFSQPDHGRVEFRDAVCRRDWQQYIMPRSQDGQHPSSIDQILKKSTVN